MGVKLMITSRSVMAGNPWTSPAPRIIVSCGRSLWQNNSVPSTSTSLTRILKGRVAPGSRILDAGCGDGRNLRLAPSVNAASEDYEITPPMWTSTPLRYGTDGRRSMPPENFRHEPIERMSFPDNLADVVISSAVLHFANSDEHFRAMLHGSWRVLKPGGLFFCRLASSIGIEERVREIEGRRCLLPDGSERYLVDENLLTQLTAELGARQLDPIL